ncbi:NAD-dependent epimerase/dehydratase family protein [bacterium]|nr:NAD-dependent epimerase/dehydratase family protein [bacterium]
MYDEEDEPPPRRIAITGISGYVGRTVALMLEMDDTTERVLGIDIAPYAPLSERGVFEQRSVEEPFDELFVKHQIDAAIHLAFVLNPMRDRAKEERVNITGTQNFLDACAKAKVKTVLVASSATAYGALPDNPEVLWEGAPLRAAPDFPYAHDKVRVEDLCYEFAKKNPDVCLQIVRPCVIIGPNVSNFISRLLDKTFFFGAIGYDPPVQFIHEDDAARAIFRLLKSRKVGVFNLAGDGALTMGRVAELAHRTVIRLPAFLLRAIVWLGWKLGISSITEAPPGFLDYTLHPWLISNVKLKTELLFLFKYDGPRAFVDFLDRRGSPSPVLPSGDFDIEDEDGLDQLEPVPPVDLPPPSELLPPGSPPAMEAPVQESNPAPLATGQGEAAKPPGET